MEIALAIIFGAIIVGVLIWRFKLGPFKASGSPNDIDSALKRLGIPAPDISFSEMSPKGAMVKSPVPVPYEAFLTIDAALDELFTLYKQAFPHWTKGFQHNAYGILFVNPMAINQIDTPGSPALKVQGQQTAGTCIGFPFPMVWIVLPHQDAQDWSFMPYLYHSVFNEGEHFIESLNDREVFNRYTGLNDVHRHVVGAAGFKSIRPLGCGIEKAL